MTRLATAAAVGAVGLVASAGVVAVLGGSDLVPASATSATPTTSTQVPESALLEAGPSPAPTTAPRAAHGPLTRSDAVAALPRVGEVFGPADVEVELASVCEGATFDLFGATPVYASLQSIEAPLAYLDVVVIVYDTELAARTASDLTSEAIVQCPRTRSATPPPTAPGEAPIPIDIEGEVRSGVVVDDLPAMQWVQIQSADGTELRTAITVVRLENALVAVSMDQDADTIEADDLAEESIAHAVSIIAALSSAIPQPSAEQQE